MQHSTRATLAARLAVLGGSPANAAELIDRGGPTAATNGEVVASS
jgi:hypothetical protein